MSPPLLDPLAGEPYGAAAEPPVELVHCAHQRGGVSPSHLYLRLQDDAPDVWPGRGMIWFCEEFGLLDVFRTQVHKHHPGFRVTHPWPKNPLQLQAQRKQRGQGKQDSEPRAGSSRQAVS